MAANLNRRVGALEVQLSERAPSRQPSVSEFLALVAPDWVGDPPPAEDLPAMAYAWLMRPRPPMPEPDDGLSPQERYLQMLHPKGKGGTWQR